MLCDKHPASLVVTRVQYNGMELESFRCIQPGRNALSRLDNTRFPPVEAIEGLLSSWLMAQ